MNTLAGTSAMSVSVAPPKREVWAALLIFGLILADAASISLRNQLGFSASPGSLPTHLAQFESLLVNSIAAGFNFALFYVIFVLAYRVLNIHKRFGIFRGVEPEAHFWTSMRNWKVPFLWGIGLGAACFLFQIDSHSIQLGQHPRLLFQLPDKYVFLHSPNTYTDILYAVVGFYLIDLTDWTGHWINHKFPILYRKFPVAHFVHHNLVYLNPMVVFASPLVHFAEITGLCMYALMLSQGLLAPVFFISIVKLFSNFSSHLGCDPFPWLTRLNHRVGGWIPWIPLHHQYHHIPTVKGNYGNITCLWDYVFGTVSPDTVQHIEERKPTARVADIMANTSGQIDRFMRGKVRLSM